MDLKRHGTGPEQARTRENTPGNRDKKVGPSLINKRRFRPQSKAKTSKTKCKLFYINVMGYRPSFKLGYFTDK
jgi:hypothetical protein